MKYYESLKWNTTNHLNLHDYFDINVTDEIIDNDANLTEFETKT